MFYVFDLDGTLADLTHRKHFLETKDWRSFFAAVGDDKPIWSVIELLQSLAMADNYIEIWSGRSDECRAATEAWILEHVGFLPLVLMRTAGDKRPDDEVKRDFLRMSQQPDIIFDDRDRVVAMWRSLGITCLQVAPGDF